MSSLKGYILLSLIWTAVSGADPGKRSSEPSTDPLPKLTFLIQNGWIPPHMHCGAILSGLAYAPATFPFLPDGGLSQTLRGFHPSKLETNGDVSLREVNGRHILRGPYRGAVVERAFEKVRTGYRPLNWGTFDTAFQEYDPIYGLTRFHYTMNAPNVVINHSTASDVWEIEERLAHQIRHSISPLNLKMVSDLLAKERTKNGQVRITRDTAVTATGADPDDDLGVFFFSDPDVTIAPLFCFHHAPDRILQVDYDLAPDNLSFSLKAIDNQGFTQKVKYILSKVQTGLALMELQLGISKENIHAELRIDFGSRQTAIQTMQRHYGFERHLDIHAEVFNQKYQERILALSDGVIELREVTTEHGRGYAPVFFANLQDSVNGRIELKVSTALSVNFLGSAIPPVMIQYKHRYYEIIYNNATQVTLVDKKTGQKYQGGYWYKEIADYEAGYVPMLYFSIRGLPGN